MRKVANVNMLTPKVKSQVVILVELLVEGDMLSEGGGSMAYRIMSHNYIQRPLYSSSLSLLSSSDDDELYPF